MRGRSTLGAVVFALLLALPGCGGSSGGATTNEALQDQQQLERQLSRYAQQQLRVRLRDRSVTVDSIDCQHQPNGPSACIVAVSDGTGHHGTLSLAVNVDQQTHTAQISFVRASNRRWSAAVGG